MTLNSHFRYLLINGSCGYKLFFHSQIYQKICSTEFLRATFSRTHTKKLHVVKESSDPIVKKYSEMLLNLSKQADPTIEDSVYETNFGSIRFDSDNSFASKKNGDHVMKEENVDMADTSTKYLNYFDEVYFKDSIYHTSLGNLRSKQKRKLVKPKINLENFKKTADLNYIDTQYLIEPNLNTIAVHSTKYIDKYSGVSEEDILDFNYLDSQYFGQVAQSVVDEKRSDINHKNTTNLKINDNFEIDNEENSKAKASESTSISNASLFSFEESLLENSDMRITYVNDSSGKESPNVSRESLEMQLLDLSERVSENLLKRNPHLKGSAKEDKTENENESQSEALFAIDNAHAVKESSQSVTAETKNIKSAYDYVMEKRKEEHKNIFKQVEDVLPNEKFKKILFHVPRFSQFTQHDMVKLLTSSVLYNQDDIAALYKPYGIPVHKGPGNLETHRFNIVDLLPHVAEVMKEDQLIPCHRLDINTTGVLLLAKTEAKAEELKKKFADHTIRKTYITITKGIPTILNGIIDIPIGTGKIEKYQRMVLYPDLPGSKVCPGKAKKAITRYKVLSRANSCALLEVTPITGVKHQVRVHLAFGLGCPVLADHKYSFLRKIAPQKLPGDALEKLGMRQSLVRHLPFHLHALSIGIPGLGKDGREVFIKAAPPKFFKVSATVLQLNKRRNRLSNDYSETIYGYN